MLHSGTYSQRPGVAWLAAPGCVLWGVCAKAAELGPGAEPVFATERLAQVLLGLAVVLGAIVAAAWLGRRLMRVRPGGAGRLRVLGGLSLGTRERIVLIQAGETQLLVGVAPGRVQTLHVLDEPLAEDPVAVDAGVELPFARVLERFTGGARTGA